MTNEFADLVHKLNIMLRMLREEYTRYVPIEPRGMPKNVDREVCRGKIQILSHVLDLCTESEEENFPQENERSPLTFLSS